MRGGRFHTGNTLCIPLNPRQPLGLFFLIYRVFQKKEPEIEILIPRELLNILENGNHHIILRHGVFFLLIKLILLSQMTEHEWFEGTLLEMAMR